MVWRGKITNGRPDSTWTFSDINNPNSPSCTEHFKKGKFIRGKNPIIAYDDVSHIVLVDENLLPISNAERFAISPMGCNAGQFNNATNFALHTIENARYFNGTDVFTAKINAILYPVAGNVRIAGADARIVLDGIIDEKGNIGKFISDDKFDESVCRRIISDLESLPRLIPATYDKIPAKQKFRIMIVFNNYSYRFSYQFLSVIPPGVTSK